MKPFSYFVWDFGLRESKSNLVNPTTEYRHSDRFKSIDYFLPATGSRGDERGERRRLRLPPHHKGEQHRVRRLLRPHVQQGRAERDEDQGRHGKEATAGEDMTGPFYL